MNELKTKFMDLIRNQENNKVPIIDYGNNSLNFYTPIKIDKTNEKKIDTKINEELCSDSDILHNIDSIYFTEDLHPSRYELEKLSGALQVNVIENNLHKLQSQLAVVSKRVFHMILENQSLCQKEFMKMQDLQQSLAETLSICQNARANIHEGQKLFTIASLSVLKNYRKRKIVEDVSKSLNTIKTLLQTEARLVKLLNEGNYADAISLLLQCQQAALSYKHFQCIATLSGKLQDTLVIAEEQLDVALADICYKFDESVYSGLQAAYSQLGKRRIAMDQLHMHYTSAIHSSAFNVICQYVIQENFQSTKKPYIQLCQQVENDKFITCLLKLCQSMWYILRSFNQVVEWHNKNQFENSDSGFEQNINEQYIKRKLESGLGKLWHDIQSRISILISNSDVTAFKFDDFLQFLAILHRLVLIGEEFCGSDSAEIQTSIKGQSSQYFRKYHLSRLEELRLFLENDAWTPCPVKPNFNLLHLQEFRNLRNVIQKAFSKKSQKHTDITDSLSNSSNGFFYKFSDTTPFDTCLELDCTHFNENILLDNDDDANYFSDDSDEDDSHSRSQNSYTHYKPKKHSILLTNTTLTVLRHCGRYLQMSHLLRSITTDTLLCLKQLFDYYLYAVCSFFIADIQIITHNMCYTTQKLLAVLKRIESNLIRSDENKDFSDNKVIAPTISPAVDLRNPESLFGLTERVVGVESLNFLAEQYNLLQDYLRCLTDEENQAHALELFYSQEVSIATEVRKPVYECVAKQVIDYKHILNMMSKVNWEVKDVMCQHSPYIDILFRDLQVFLMRLEGLSSAVQIPSEVVTCLWHSLAEVLAEIFVEGFANVKKCSNGGRALMLLDFTQLMSKLEVLSSLKPIPKREYVENYVRAYYLPETSIQSWIQEHSEYSSKQMQSLVNCKLYNNKRARQKLLSMIEEMERR